MGETKDICLRFMGLIDAHKVEEAAALCAPDARFTVSGLGDADLETWKHFVTAMVDAVPDTKHPVSNVVEVGDQVFVEFRWQGTHTRPLLSPQGEIPATGKRIDIRCSSVFEVEAGRITAERGYFDQVEFLTQLGLMPAPVAA
jgi:steroid delta-isomerase-like uncharacterized protein